MPGTHENGSGDSRLDRLEGLMALLIEDHVRFDDEHKRLLTAQVVLTDRVDRLAIKLDSTIGAIQDLTTAQRHSDERMNALISVVNGIVRHLPPQQPS
jgi:hypothetical protein